MIYSVDWLSDRRIEVHLITTRQTPVYDLRGNPKGNTIPKGTRLKSEDITIGSGINRNALYRCITATGESLWLDGVDLNQIALVVAGAPIYREDQKPTGKSLLISLEISLGKIKMGDEINLVLCTNVEDLDESFWVNGNDLRQAHFS